MYIHDYSSYLQNRYGKTLYRVPLDAGFSCPHRKKGAKNRNSGCTFCPEDGARAIQLGKAKTLAEQIEKGILFARRRYQATAFMAYFQAFTTTFATFEELHSLTAQILNIHPFRAIAFGIRPDCLPQQTVNWLAALQQELGIDLWIELGIQSTKNPTLHHINRGHSWQTSKDAITRLAAAELPIAAHLIIGLPGETRPDWLTSVQKLTSLPITALKLHNLHIIKNTALAKEWQESPFSLLNEYGYIEELLAILPIIPKHIPIIRLTTDTPKSNLLAPEWRMTTGQFRKKLFGQMKMQGISQGSALRSVHDTSATTMQHNSKKITTDDGSITFYNEQIREHYHTLAGARSEAEQKYILPSHFKERLKKVGRLRLLDICFGLGYNSLVACETALHSNTSLEITALEMDKRVVMQAASTISSTSKELDWNKALRTLLDKGTWQHAGLSITLVWGDARHTIQHCTPFFDCVWLDAFSTQKNSELWTVDFFKKIYPLLAADGTMLTYCAAIPVRSGLAETGFSVYETKAFGRERGGTIACNNNFSLNNNPRIKKLPKRDLFLMTTPRGIPYRDPDGLRTNKEILRMREAEILRKKEGTT